MDKTFDYTQTKTNFDSVYNILSDDHRQTTKSILLPSSSDFSTSSNRLSSPLFHRCASPPPRRPVLDGSGIKFNFDLYKMDGDAYDLTEISSFIDCSLPSSASRVVRHKSSYSPVSSPRPHSETLSKLRQLNYELRNQLIQTETDIQRPVHYHIHHYPLSQLQSREYRCRSTSKERSSSTERKTLQNIHKAAVTYRVHASPLSVQTSDCVEITDIYPSDESTVIDLYPSQHKSFIKLKRKHKNDQRAWLIRGASVRHDSCSNPDAREAIESLKGPYYGDKPIKICRRSGQHREYSASASWQKSSSQTYRARNQINDPYVSGRNQESSTSITDESSVRRLDRSNKKRRVNNSYISSAKSKPPLWDTKSSHNVKSSSRGESISAEAEHIESSRKHSSDEAVSESRSQRKSSSNRKTVQDGSEHPKNHINNSSDKENSKLLPSKQRLSTPTNQYSKPIQNVQKTQDTSQNESIKPEVESKSRNLLKTNETFENASRLPGNEPSTPKRPIKAESPRSPSNIEHPSTPPKDQTQTTAPIKPSAQSNTSTPDKDIKSLHDENSRSSSPSENQDDQSDNDDKETEPQPKTIDSRVPSGSTVVIPEPSPLLSTLTKSSDNSNNRSVIQNDTDNNGKQPTHDFNIGEWLKNATNSIIGPTKENGNPPPPAPSLSKSKPKSPPRRKQQPPSPTGEVTDDDLYNPPFGPKRKNQQTTDNATPVPPTSQPTTTSTVAGEDDALNDFFS